MNYADIKNFDAANGPGIRVSLFVSGCTHACKGCFNEEAWDFNYGNPYTDAEIDKIIEWLKPKHITGFTVLGGEPLHPNNQEWVCKTLRRIREVYGQSKNLWLFTGYLFDDDVMGWMVPSLPYTREILSYLDVIMDGPYIEEQKDLGAYFRGSSNQRAIAVPESLAAENIVLWEPEKPKYIYSPT